MPASRPPRAGSRAQSRAAAVQGAERLKERREGGGAQALNTGRRHTQPHGSANLGARREGRLYSEQPGRRDGGGSDCREGREAQPLRAVPLRRQRGEPRGAPCAVRVRPRSARAGREKRHRTAGVPFPCWSLPVLAPLGRGLWGPSMGPTDPVNVLVAP